MAESTPVQRRLKGKKSINMAAQELAWSADVPLGRIDWHPDPETEDAGAATQTYLVTLLTDAGEAHGTVPATLVEKAPDARDGTLKDILDRMIAELQRQQA